MNDRIVLRVRDLWAAKRQIVVEQWIQGQINRRVDYAVRERLEPYRRDLVALQRAVQNIEAHLSALEENQTRLGEFMSEIDDKLAEVDSATTLVADKVDRQAAEIKRLGDLLAAVDPSDSAEVERLQGELGKAVSGLSGVAEHLRAIAADPANPAPEPPADTEPGTDSGSDAGDGSSEG